MITPRLPLVLVASLGALAAQEFVPASFSEMRWRAIGPHRGGRTRAITGVRGQPATFYAGVCNGGVWKTTDAGRTWRPIFDDQPTGSIGAIAVAPSAPHIVYVGSGEGLHRPDLSTGNGIYKSTDAGASWTHLGLRDGQQIPALAVDPRDPDRVFAAVLGHPYGPNDERGIFRSTDGGRTFAKVLYVDADTGGCDVDIDPENPSVVYATLWEARQGPWENAAWSGTRGGIFKSTDGGTTWRKLTTGLPDENEGGVVQANLAVAPGRPQRLYATVASRRVGIYRSDDAGESWTEVTQDPRPAGRIGGGDLPMPVVDPRDHDVVLATSTVAWRSTDGGRTWTALKGAPGGDDYQNGWISPDSPLIIALASDQGAVVSLNGGETWSSWYNQPTAQLYHVSADNAFPYRVYSGQQESGSVGIASRGDDGQITFREWHPVGVDEYGYVAPDPLDPDVIYGGRRVTRFDRRTGQVVHVGPPTSDGDQRIVRTQPVVFSTVDPKTLFYANNMVWKTTNGGTDWQRLSDDLTRATWAVPASVGRYRDQASAQPSQRGVIYTIAPSYVDVGRIWVGTDDGLIHTTADGGQAWIDVTPPALGPWMKVSLLDAGRFDAATAYAAVNTIRLDDMRPHIYRTHDGGKTWTEITAGLPPDAPVNAVREDPVRRGLLFAGTERAVHVSFDDGDHWHPLRLDMAASSVRDLIVKNDDLVAATHGRGFWILDNITPLRQLTGQPLTTDAVLFAPQDAYRVRWNQNPDTPLPPDEPTAKNPPEGAIIDFFLRSDATGPVTITIRPAFDLPVRWYSSEDEVMAPNPDTAPVPLYWYRPPQGLRTTAGLHRFAWDLRYQPLEPVEYGGSLPIAAIPHDTAPAPTTPLVPPGQYVVDLTVNGETISRPLTVRLDPRVRTPEPELRALFAATHDLYSRAAGAAFGITQIDDLRAQLDERRKTAADRPIAATLAEFDAQLLRVRGEPVRARGRRGGNAAGADNLTSVVADLSAAMNALGRADVTPTTATLQTCERANAAYRRVWANFEPLVTDRLADLSTQLAAAGLAEVKTLRR